MTQEIKNATVDSTNLGIEDHGIFCMNVNFEYEYGCHQGTGGYSIPGLMAEKAIKSYLKLFNVSYWEELVGKKCQVRIDNGFIKAIRRNEIDNWTELKEIFSEDEPMKAFRLLGEAGQQ